MTSIDFALRIEDVSKRLAGKVVLESISLAVALGETVALVGPNGAGKTTLFRLILGLLRPDAGAIDLLGESNRRPSARRRVGFCLDNDGLYQGLDAKENVDFFRTAYGIEAPALDFLHQLGAEGFGTTRVSRYSRGMRKRLGLARALVCSPQLILLDEPLAGLDPDGQHELVELLRGMSASRAVLVSSHDLAAVESVCDRIVVLNQRVFYDGSVESFREQGESMFDAYRSVLEGECS